jgi:hypothetical protein
LVKLIIRQDLDQQRLKYLGFLFAIILVSVIAHFFFIINLF